MRKIFKSLFLWKKIPIFVETEILVKEMVEIEEGDVSKILDLFSPELEMMSEIWVETIINREHISGITKSPEYSRSTIAWIGDGNMTTSTNYKKAGEWLKNRSNKLKPILMETEIRVGGQEEGEGSWVLTTVDLSRCLIVSSSSLGDKTILWMNQEKVMINDSLEQVIKILKEDGNI